DADEDGAMAQVLSDLARLGLTSVHSMDSARGLGSLQRLRSRGPLPVRVTYNLPLADLPHAERMGVRSGWGDPWLRFWGVKAFLDGSLGSRTAEMLDGSGTARLAQPDLVDMIERCARAELNVCLHAIGDGAVRPAPGSEAPVEVAGPLAGIEAATKWRRLAGWHPELALTRASARRAYTSGAAYAVGMERELGALRAGRQCDMTVVDGGEVTATIAGGRVTWRRKPA